jgi:hypothetical protein
MTIFLICIIAWLYVCGLFMAWAIERPPYTWKAFAWPLFATMAIVVTLVESENEI